MKNPLRKRLPRELKSEFGKFIVIFIFIAGMIGIVSGFLVATNSTLDAYNASFEKYNIEDGNFELLQEADKELLDSIEEEGVTLYNNFYKEESPKEVDATIRIFRVREEVNKSCLMEGTMPASSDEIVIDRMFADNNKIKVSDTLTFGEQKFTISGFIALPDYSALFSNNTDLMFDSMKFCVALVTRECFDDIPENHLHYNYSWIFDEQPKDKVDAKQKSDELMKTINSYGMLYDFIPEYGNQAIHFTGNDMTGDSSLFTVFLYIIIAIIAFIFAITTSNTISREATVIGTLRASGYKKSEIVRHYMLMPMLVTIVAAIVGNVLGYTYFKNYMADMYYSSYSLPTYKTLWNADAFLKTTVVPLILMFLINLIVLVRKLSLSPLKFIRKDLSRRRKKKAFRLSTKIKFMTRFRIRIIVQNMPNYITIFIGVFLANVILLFGLGLDPLLDHMEDNIQNNMLSEYQSILKVPVETSDESAEKYTILSLKTKGGRIKSEEVSIYGVEEESNFINLSIKGDEVYISNAYANKHHLSVGDSFTVIDEFDEKSYEFEVSGIYEYPSSIAVFMNRTHFNEVFDYETEYFNAYFSNGKIADIDDQLIATTITCDDLTKTSRQLRISFDGFIALFTAFGVIIYMLIIYLLSKIIIEKNSNSVSMTKILGYTNREINGLYIRSTTIVVIASLLLNLPLANLTLSKTCEFAFSSYPGWFEYYVSMSTFAKMAILGILSYAVIAFLQMRKVKKIPMAEALKNVE